MSTPALVDASVPNGHARAVKMEHTSGKSNTLMSGPMGLAVGSQSYGAGDRAGVISWAITAAIVMSLVGVSGSAACCPSSLSREQIRSHKRLGNTELSTESEQSFV